MRTAVTWLILMVIVGWAVLWETFRTGERRGQRGADRWYKDHPSIVLKASGESWSFYGIYVDQVNHAIYGQWPGNVTPAVPKP